MAEEQRDKDMGGAVSHYIKNNIVRIIELVFIIGVVAATMQKSITEQGEVLVRLTNQLQQQSIVLSDLAISVAQLSIRVGHSEEDTDELKEQLEKNREDCINLMRKGV